MKDVKIENLFNEAMEDEVSDIIRKHIRMRLNQPENMGITADIKREVDKLLVPIGIKRSSE